VTAIRIRLRREHESDGFTLIELVVALTIATVIFSAMAAAGLAGVRASTIARQNQQSVDVLNRALEEARGISYASLAMVESDLQVDDDAISGSPPQYTVPNGVGAEDIWLDDTGSVNPHVQVADTTGTIEYTTRTYVTVPDGYTLDTAGQPNQKRLTVVVTWEAYGEERERVISTLLTETTRGLPLPRYGATPTSPTTQTKNPSTTLVWGFQVVNRGARDTFNISASSGTWAYYVDTDCDGARDADETTQLTNSDAGLGDTRPDTGKLEPNNYPPYCVVAQRAIGSTETGTSSVTFNLESSAQPSANGADVAVGPFTVTVTTGSTGGSGTPTPTGTGTATAPTTVCEPTTGLGSGTPFGFRNGTSGTSGATTSQLVNSMTENTCMNQPSAANYSTDAGSGTGRSLTTGGTVTTSTASQRAEWRWNPASTKTVAASTATISVMVSCPVAGSNLTLNGALGTFNEKNSLWTSRGTGSTTVSCATANSWARVTVPITVATSFTVANKVQGQPQHLSARLWVTGGSAGQQLRLNYEQSDAKSFLFVNVS
jgi:prepilin-type N-terminal cleavage/methylation domain-containing protein